MPYSELESLIAKVPDFPHEGILFRDISPLLAQKFPETISALAGLFSENEIKNIDSFAGVDSRGFIFAGALATLLNKQFIMVRKAGKLPKPYSERQYDLEYGSATLQVKPGAGRVVVVDDVLATGGTLAAAADLCQEAGFDVYALLTLIDLRYLNNFEWNGQKVRSLIQYEQGR